MSIEDKINKYLKEKSELKRAGKKKAIEKIRRAMRSTTNVVQLRNVEKMISTYEKQYEVPLGDKVLKNFWDMYKDQKERFELIKNLKK